MFARLPPIPFQLPGLSVKASNGLLFSSSPFFGDMNLMNVLYHPLSALSSEKIRQSPTDFSQKKRQKREYEKKNMEIRPTPQHLLPLPSSARRAPRPSPGGEGLTPRPALQNPSQALRASSPLSLRSGASQGKEWPSPFRVRLTQTTPWRDTDPRCRAAGRRWSCPCSRDAWQARWPPGPRRRRRCPPARLPCGRPAFRRQRRPRW